MNLEELNHATEGEFLRLIGGPLEGETWLATKVIAARPFPNLEALIAAFEREISNASEEEKIALIASHPDLANKLAVLSESSVKEQAAAGLNQLTEAEYKIFSELNSNYRERFGFPFVICAREHDKQSILDNFRRRIALSKAEEIATASREVFKILALRLKDMVE